MSRGESIVTLSLDKASPLHAVSNVLPQALLKTVPGVAKLQRFFKSWLNVDIATLAVFVTLFGALSGGAAHLDSVYFRIRSWIIKFFTAAISVAGNDQLNRELLNWLSANVLARRRTQKMTAQSQAIYGDNWAYLIRDDRAQELGQNIQYLPTFEVVWFFFERHLFIVRRGSEGRTGDGADKYATAPSGKEALHIMCLGRSVEPIKRFLAVCREFTANQRQSFVTIHQSLDSLAWESVILRPRRMLDTVHFDKDIKEELVADIENYVKKETRQFYMERGIPYRRGYLLHGPPGTGKTSLSFALAGHFQLDLFIIHLPKIEGDRHLEILFLLLPPQCVVVIEDIDCVGLTRERKIAEESRPKLKEEKSSKTDECTLSGLLNVLDGVTAQQGRIVLMTTNDIDGLDAALTRPGRVDKAIYLGRMGKTAARHMFLTFYTPIHTLQKLPSMKLENLATEFSNKIPNEVFTPAQLQGYLLDHTNEPETAVSKFPQWAIQETRMKTWKTRGKQECGIIQAKTDEKSKDDENGKLNEPENSNDEDEDAHISDSDSNSESGGSRPVASESNKPDTTDSETSIEMISSNSGSQDLSTSDSDKSKVSDSEM